jgi:hypothetical protein
MSEIPQSYIDQAVRPRGQTVNERLNFLLNWYVTTGTKTAKDATWDYQIEFNNLMAQFGNTLRPILCRDSDEDTSMAINNFFPVIEYMRNNSRSAAGSAFFTYLSIELRKVLGA